MTHLTSPRRDLSSRRFDMTLAGDANLDILLYGLPEDLALEREQLADGIAIHPGVSAAITAHNLAALGDSVGAGDSFNAGFLHAWTRGWPIGKALACRNLTGSWSAGASGGTSAFREPHSRRALDAAMREILQAQSLQLPP